MVSGPVLTPAYLCFSGGMFHAVKLIVGQVGVG